MTEEADNTFAGAWYSYHWYPTIDDAAEESSEYQMTAHQEGDQVVFESKPTENGAYMLARLDIDGDIASGSWHEDTSPQGEYEGMLYSGAGQLIVAKDKRTMEGLWAGAGMDHTANKLRIYTGRWEFRRERRPSTD
ncbi:MAG TPA: hypothetical protein VGO07_03345 [Candidatus Saccharimonadales bacterium]|jgi:hypothetical protein|nr:hypothetical protein [Candidatus Saccharimonadales bacterium]